MRERGCGCGEEGGEGGEGVLEVGVEVCRAGGGGGEEEELEFDADCERGGEGGFGVAGAG